MGPEASINKAADNSKGNADNISDPIVHIGTAIKDRLDEFNETTEGTRRHKHREQSKAPSSREGQGECRKSDDVYELVTTVWCWR